MFQPIDEDTIASHVTETVLQAYVYPHKYLKGSLTDKQLDQFAKARAKENEFNVLAGLVYWHGNDLSTIKIVALTTGVKCTPDEKLENTNGRVLHDMHAEILAIRGLTWHVMGEMRRFQVGEWGDMLDVASEEESSSSLINKYKLVRDVRFALYISELPCGDSSLDEMMQNDPDSTAWEADDCTVKEPETKKIKYSDEEPSRPGLRAGESFHRVGIVRTKPGRRDSPVCSSKSCSDKLTFISLNGIFKGIIGDIMEEEHIGLDYLVLPQMKVERNEKAIKRCFDERLDLKDVDLCQLIRILKAPDIISQKYYDVLKEKKLGILEIDRNKIKRANELSLICLPESKEMEVVNKGVKNGCAVKSVVKTAKGVSILSRYSLFQKRNGLVGNAYRTDNYNVGFKKRLSNHHYSEFSRYFRNMLGDWGNQRDNFDLASTTKG